jgi:hypothetical protein
MTVSAIALTIAWLLLALLSAASHPPTFSRRAREYALIGVSLVLAASWTLAAAKHMGFWPEPQPAAVRAEVTQASVVKARPRSQQRIAPRSARCSLVSPGMSEQEVTAKLRRPHAIEDASLTRGPGSQAWRYDDDQCVVYMFAKKVDYVEIDP